MNRGLGGGVIPLLLLVDLELKLEQPAPSNPPHGGAHVHKRLKMHMVFYMSFHLPQNISETNCKEEEQSHFVVCLVFKNVHL